MITTENKTNYPSADIERLWPRLEDDVVPPFPNYDIYRHRFPDSLGDMSWSDAVYHLVTAGQMASSSHNMQQWKVEANAQRHTVAVYSDEKYIGIPADVTGREAHVSVGNFAENCIAFLHAYGLVPRLTLETRKGRKHSLLSVVFDAADLPNGKLIRPDLLTLIHRRRIYRGPFDRTFQMPKSSLSEMQQMAHDIGLDLKLITELGIKTPLGLFQFSANNIVLHQPDFRKELGEFLLPNESRATRGMSGASFGLNDVDAAEAHEELLTGKTLQGKFATGFPNADKNAIISSAVTAVIMSPKDTPEYWLKGGMLMDRLWLYAQSQGMGVGVMAGMVEVAAMASKLTKALGMKGVPTAVLRMGKPLESTWARSPRTTVGDILTFV